MLLCLFRIMAPRHARYRAAVGGVAVGVAIGCGFVGRAGEIRPLHDVLAGYVADAAPGIMPAFQYPQCMQRSTERGAFVLREPYDRQPADIGHDLAPGSTVGAASGQHNFR